MDNGFSMQLATFCRIPAAQMVTIEVQCPAIPLSPYIGVHVPPTYTPGSYCGDLRELLKRQYADDPILKTLDIPSCGWARYRADGPADNGHDMIYLNVKLRDSTLANRSRVDVPKAKLSSASKMNKVMQEAMDETDKRLIKLFQRCDREKATWSVMSLTLPVPPSLLPTPAPAIAAPPAAADDDAMDLVVKQEATEIATIKSERLVVKKEK